jgi:UDPglucose--hexose-1-phosphate uridylyltransferase
MPDLHRDHLHRTWVIVAPDRARRPRDTVVTDGDTAGSDCPFCPGREGATPPEVMATGRPAGSPANQPPWRVRVVPNLYPALEPPQGHHEVIIATAAHKLSLADLTVAEAAEFLDVGRQRVRQLARRPGVAAVSFFVNVGAAAGASLRHLHGQALALPMVPPALAIELDAVGQWRQDHGECMLCAEARAAEPGGLLVARRPGVLARCPQPSRHAWEVCLQPTGHQGRFVDVEPGVLHDLAELLVLTCGALKRAAGDPAYNLVLHEAPAVTDDFHWHLELTPRLSALAGFETGSGCHINSLPPEDAARVLRRHIEAEQAGRTA